MKFSLTKNVLDSSVKKKDGPGVIQNRFRYVPYIRLYPRLLAVILEQIKVMKVNQ